MVKMVLVTKANISQVQCVEAPMPPLASDAVRLKIESFSVTANNVTYAAIGDMFGYWNFFPATDGKGIVPMWGHAVVEESNHTEISVGERVYGYLPMGSHLDVQPGNITEGGFLDTAAHRQPMSSIYNQYSRLAADPEHDPAREDARMIFGPLFKTGFLIESMFRREGWFGAEQLVMTSASSKTSLGLASVAKDLSPTIRRVGLTSRANVAFVEGTGLYDEVLAYDDLSALPKLPSVSVDFAGNSKLLASLHAHFGDALAYSCLVGATHIEARGQSDSDALAGPKPILFFAPDHATATIKALGPKNFGVAVAASWAGFVGVTEGVITIDHRDGLDAAADAFIATVKGGVDPAVGIVIRP
ncbi:MAG: DUF2855 family protein [Chakrabartia sp.]